jgi:hypothetical protein
MSIESGMIGGVRDPIIFIFYRRGIFLDSRDKVAVHDLSPTRDAGSEVGCGLLY